MAVRLKRLAGLGDLAKHVPFPARDANKYTRGKLVVVGGSAPYPGAACLASLAAYRMGAGYVEVVCSPQSLSVVRSFNPNVVARSWEGWQASSSGLHEADPGHPSACLVGCGFDPDGREEAGMVLEALRFCRHPVVVDGGAVSALASEEGRAAASLRAEAGLVTVVTPHFGEAARLGASFKAKPPRDPARSKDCARFAQQLADAYGASVVLKGPDTFLAHAQIPHAGKDDTVRVMDSGTPALAKAGTGDVLAGMLAALLAQGLSARRACELAVALHAQAGRVAAESLTEVSVCATDVAESIPKAVADIC